MKLISTYSTVQYKSTRNGGTGEVQRYEGLVEIYTPAVKANDWYLVIVWGVFEDGSERELSKVIIKR